jgi:hypothetical protein
MGNAQEEEDIFKKVVPPHYHDYKDIFDKKDFDQLPDRQVWDHVIELTEDFKPVDCKVYPLNPNEQKALDEFIEENLSSGRIRPSKSPMASLLRRAGGGSREREQVDKQVYWWFQVENMHGKAHLSMDVATESEVADTEGSTATPFFVKKADGKLQPTQDY